MNYLIATWVDPANLTRRTTRAAVTGIGKPQCTKSLGPNQPQNLKLRLCIWQQGSLFFILSYPGLFKNIPHIWFLRLYSFLKNLQHNFPKMRRGGVKGRLELFRKFIRFGAVGLPQQKWFIDYFNGRFGKPPPTKTDEFSEKFQTAFDPPSHFRKIILQILGLYTGL